MKKIFALIVFIALAIIFIPWLQPKSNATEQHQAVFWVDQKVYLSDGQKIAIDVAPFIHEERVYVPIRYLAYALGISEDNVSWDEESQTATFSTDSVVLKMTVGNDLLYVNEETRVMDVVPVEVSDRMFVPGRWLAEALGYEVAWDEPNQALLIGLPDDLPEASFAETTALPVVGSYENLKSLLAEVQPQIFYSRGLSDKFASGAAELESVQSSDVSADQASSTGAGDYSGTNVQVAGVDEADIVKTDGSYIYLLQGQRVVIAKAYPAAEMAVVSTLSFGDENFMPREIYVDERHLIVIGQTGRYVVMPMAEESEESAPVDSATARIYPPVYSQDAVKAIIYDISNKSAPQQLRELELEGSYISSRKIGSAFYLLSNKYLYYYAQSEEGTELRPFYRDTAVSNAYSNVGYADIRCFPNFRNPDYLMVAGINLDRLDEKADIHTYLGSGGNIYVSPDNLYVTVTNYQYDSVDSNKTEVYKFALDEGKLSYTANGQVPGTVLNQFSMDEYKGYLRIATTSGDAWREGEFTSKNNVYVMDAQLNIAGRLEGIAPGETIYSARFVGDRGYLVTFKTVDPFFVIDLKEPARPTILGALKIPGYSDYLHPYDENHIIGFGKDTVELALKGGTGTESVAYYMGMKVALFDVTDVSNPVELYKEEIGDRGTDSELLYNHKALLFSKDKNLLAFPVTVMEVQEGSDIYNGIPVYGEFAYQGAYIYNLDLNNGFTLKGRITHLTDEDYQKAGSYWYDSEKNVNRILYIQDDLYTLSEKYIKANNLDDLGEIGTLEIK